MKPVLILGAHGYVGSAFRRLFKEEGVLYASSVDHEYFVRSGDTDRRVSDEWSFVINAAGYVGRPNVDACEDHKAECLDGNAVFPGVVRERCEAQGTPFGHVSSGCIYNGPKWDLAGAIGHPGAEIKTGWTERDRPSASFRGGRCSWYSGTKALGEEVLEGARDCYIWRLRIPFNQIPGPRNYLSKVMTYEKLLDVRNSLTHIDQFVRAAWACWSKRVPFGTYNMTNPGSVTTREVTEMIRKHLRLDNDGVTDNADRLDARMKEYRFYESEAEFHKTVRAPRSSCVLDTSKLAATGIVMPSVQSSIEHALKNWGRDL